jgi:hypothetical protein
MSHFNTTIASFAISLELYTESDEARSDCHITKGGCSASLAALEATGELEDHVGTCIAVPPAVIERITAWATKHGY